MPNNTLTEFRNNFLRQAEAKMKEADLASIDNNGLIVLAALMRSYDTVNRFDIVLPDAVAPLELMTGASLDIYLSDISNGQSFILVLNSLEAMTAIVRSPAAMAAIAGSQQAMLAVVRYPIAYNAILGSSVALTALGASLTAMTVIAASQQVMSVVAANPTTVAIFGASQTAMAAIAASLPALTLIATNTSSLVQLAVSRVAMAAIAARQVALDYVATNVNWMSYLNATDIALDALYASPLIRKMKWATAAVWPTVTNVQSGPCLFVRLTTFGPNIWGDGTTSNECMKFDDATTYYDGHATNPYNHTAGASTTRVPVRRTQTSLQVKAYAPVEVAYIPLTY